MVSIKKSLISLISLAGVLGAISPESPDADPFKPHVVPGRYIVEYDVSSMSKREVHSSVTSTLSTKGYTVNVHQNYDSSLFQGAAFSLSDHTDSTLRELQAMSGVKRVWQASSVTLDEDMTAADQASWNPHAMTGVDALHKRGITGEGLTIALVDTGVDYNHEAVGGCLGEGCTVVAGYDFSTDTENPSDDPMDCVGHGTFVASLIVANTSVLTGVAPDAKLKMYKVFSCEDTTTDDVIIAGLLKAYEDKPDVISMSIGSDTGYNTQPVAFIAGQISNEIPVVIAAGNSGEEGVFYASSGAAGEGVISVGSAHSKQVGAWTAKAVSSGGETREFFYVSNNGSSFGDSGEFTAEVTTDNGCTHEYSWGDANALIARLGHCYVGNLYNNLNGYYSMVLLYAPDNDTVLTYLGVSEYGDLQRIGVVTNEFGLWANAQAQAGYNISIVLTDTEFVAVDDMDIEAGEMDYYSSWGPTFENQFYPVITGPGGSVFGAAAFGSYYSASGTSFSTPYIAGVVGLYLTQNPGATTKEITQRMVASAAEVTLFEKNTSTYGDDLSTLNSTVKAPAIQQGAGLVNALNMFDMKTVVTSSPFLELNDTANRIEEFTISIRNDNDESVTYDISHVAGVTVKSRTAAEWFPNAYFPPFTTDSASVSLSQSSLTLGAGESGSITVKITNDFDSDEGPVFAGKIVFEGDNGDSVGVPYMGVEVDTYEWVPWQGEPLVARYEDEYLWNLTNPANNNTFTPSEYSSPRIYFNIRYGTEILSFDIVDADFDVANYEYPPVPGKNGYLDSVRSQPDASNSYVDFPLEFPVRFSDTVFTAFQSFANGTVIPTGKYRVLSRALRMFGDRENNDDWLLYLSDPFYVVEDGELSSVSDGSSSTVSESATDVYEPTSSHVESASSESFSSEPLSSESSSSESVYNTISGIPNPVSSEEISSALVSSYNSYFEIATMSLSEIPYPTGTAEVPELEGVEIIADIKVTDYLTNTDVVYNLDDWVLVNVSFHNDERVYSTNTTQFAIPGFSGEMDLYYIYTERIDPVATVDYDGSVFTLTLTSVVDDKVIGGYFWFLFKIDSEVTDTIEGPGEMDFTAYTPTQTFVNTLKFAPRPDSEPYIFTSTSDMKVKAILDVPGSLGPWKSVEVSSNLATYDYSYTCSEFVKSIGDEFDNFGYVTGTSDAGNFSTDFCTFQRETLIYENQIDDDETLHFELALEKETTYGTLGYNIVVLVTYDDDTQKSYTLAVVERGTAAVGIYYVVLTDFPDDESSSSYEYSSSEFSSSAVESASSSVYSETSSGYSFESSAEYLSSSASSSAVASSSGVTSSSTDADGTSTPEPSSTADEPTIDGKLNDGAPEWTITIPGSIGRWEYAQVEASSDDSFNFTDASYTVNNLAYPVNLSSTHDISMTSRVYDTDGMTAFFAGIPLYGESFTVNATVTVSLVSSFRLAKREVLTWELTFTVSPDGTSSSVVQSSSISVVGSSVEASSSTVVPSSAATSSSSTAAQVSSTLASASSSSTAPVSSSIEPEASSASPSSTAPVSSSVEPEASSVASSAGFVSVSVTSSVYGSSSAVSPSPSDSDASYAIVVSPPVSSLAVSTVVEKDQATTLVTVTSCENNKCSKTTSLAAVTTVVSTSSGVETVYTTWCPLTSTGSTSETETTTTKSTEHGVTNSYLTAASSATKFSPHTKVKLSTVKSTHSTAATTSAKASTSTGKVSTVSEGTTTTAGASTVATASTSTALTAATTFKVTTASTSKVTTAISTTEMESSSTPAVSTFEGKANALTSGLFFLPLALLF